MAEELKACPFCGGKPRLVRGPCIYVRCEWCCATSDDTRAVEKWNTRTTTPVNAGLVERASRAFFSTAVALSVANGNGTMCFDDIPEDERKQLYACVQSALEAIVTTPVEETR